MLVTTLKYGLIYGVVLSYICGIKKQKMNISIKTKLIVLIIR